jgi:hypothetical protein
MNLGTRLHLGPKIRKGGAITLRTNTLSYRGKGKLYLFLSFIKQLPFYVFVFDISIQIQTHGNKRGDNTGNTNGWFR